jgi:hypothetical protein
MPTTTNSNISYEQLSKQNPEIVSIVYERASIEAKRNYEREFALLERKNFNLRSEVELLRENSRFDRDQYVV